MFDSSPLTVEPAKAKTDIARARSIPVIVVELKLIMIFKHGLEKFKLKGPIKNYRLYLDFVVKTPMLTNSNTFFKTI